MQSVSHGDARTSKDDNGPPFTSATQAVDHAVRRRVVYNDVDAVGTGMVDDSEDRTATGKGDTGRVIPGNKVFVTGPWVNDDIVEANLRWIPAGFEVHVFNDTAAARSVRHIDRRLSSAEGLRGVWEAWAALRSWAYRADLWRLLILWDEGGVYLDSKMRLTAPVEEWAAVVPGGEHLAICRDGSMRWRSARLQREVPVLWTGAMAAPAGSPVLLEAIRTLVRNVQNRTYSLLGEEESLASKHDYETLAITGPVLMGYVTAGGNFTNAVRVSCGFYHRGGGVVYRDPHRVNPDQKGLLLQIDRDENKRVHESSNVYRFLHKNRQVYCDDDRGDGSDQLNTPCDVASLLT